MGKLKMLSLFSGIGSPEAALKNLGIDYELIGFSEIDKYAVKSYCEIHGVSDQLNLGDITEINMGFSVEAFRKAEAVCSNTQLYKQAGNAVSVNVIYVVFYYLIRNNIIHE